MPSGGSRQRRVFVSAIIIAIVSAVILNATNVIFGVVRLVSLGVTHCLR